MRQNKAVVVRLYTFHHGHFSIPFYNTYFYIVALLTLYDRTLRYIANLLKGSFRYVL